MTIYREIDYNRDLDDVINLLNNNLLSGRSKEEFIWKHIENPFGQSFGCLAVDNGKIIGIRMFMKWQFRRNSRIFKCIRPVDTCTDKNHRGQGVFSNLNQYGLDALKKEYDLIFNTPNENSKPGNLKMGWQLMPQDFQYCLGLIPYESRTINFRRLQPEENKLLRTDEQTFGTHITQNFLKWRYKSPVYKKVVFNSSDLVIYKIKNLKGIRCVILCDILGVKENFSKYLFSLCIAERAFGVYFLETEKSKNFKFLFRYKRGGQTVVFREDKNNITDKVKFSLADLEATI